MLLDLYNCGPDYKLLGLSLRSSSCSSMSPSHSHGYESQTSGVSTAEKYLTSLGTSPAFGLSLVSVGAQKYLPSDGCAMVIPHYSTHLLWTTKIPN